MVQLSHPYTTTGKTIAVTTGKPIALTMWIFVSKRISMLFNMLSRFVRASLIAQLIENPPAMQNTLVQFPGLGRSSEEGIGYPLQYCWAFFYGSAGKESNLQYRRPGFSPWVGKIPWRREGLPGPVFQPGEFHGLYSPWGRKESMTATFTFTRFLIAFVPRSKHLLISWLQSPSAVILEPKKRKSVTISIVSPSICHEVMGPDAMILVFWMLSFKPPFLLSSFTFIKRPISSSLLSSIRVVSSAYLRLLIFLLAILIPACASSSLVFHMMYSAYKLNKQDDSIQPWCTPFTIWNQFIFQISQEAGKVIWYSHLFKNFPQFVVTHTVKGFTI